jgi:hypothetical protein
LQPRLGLNAFGPEQTGVGGFFDLVAEIDGRIVGSNFLDERNPISGVGPITIDPAIQNEGVGRALMQAIMRRSQERGFAGMRLVQAGYHSRSLALYLKLGFEVREPLACLQGPPYVGTELHATHAALGLPIDRKTAACRWRAGERMDYEHGVWVLCNHAERAKRRISAETSRTTEIYLKGGAKALRDTDYVPCEAPLTLAEMLK